MPTMRVFFGECEHSGDLDSYGRELREAGLSVVGGGLGDSGGEGDGDTGWLDVSYAAGEWASVVSTLRGTEAFGFYAGNRKVEDR